MSPPCKRPCVLLVDDDSTVRKALHLLLDSLGWEAIEACNARQAMEHLQERPYDLAIIDIKMPETNGIELCRLIHLHTAHPPAPLVMILSGYIDPNYRAAAMAAGASAILEKPIGRDELSEAIRKQGLPCTP